ncbi:MAG: hypothetical protein ACTHNP_01680 [Solirubrobacterales bacterium]
MGSEIFLLVIAFLIALPVIYRQLRPGRSRGWAAFFSRSRILHLILAGAVVFLAVVKSPLVALVFVLLLLAFLIWLAYRERVAQRARVPRR